jgi:sugar/nucleoside kinase (ribokinase family)
MSGADAAIDVLVVGDANPDLLLTGDTVPRFGQAEQLLESADLVLGGSAAIVACGLAKLGISTALAAVVGADRFGAFVVDQLQQANVRTSFVAESDSQPTGLSVVLSQPHDRGILTLPGTIPHLTADAVRCAVEACSPRHVHVASYYLQPSLAADLPALLVWLAERGIRVSLDTNWDPAGSWLGLERILPSVSVFMPNREEALAIAAVVAGHPVDDLEAAGAVLSRLGCRVVVKSGADGGYAFDAGALSGRSGGLSVDVVDTTGAGDSFDAGYLAACTLGVEAEDTRLRWAAIAGSLSVRGVGGTGTQATADDIRARLDAASLRDTPGAT